jgi:hypothetical protein
MGGQELHIVQVHAGRGQHARITSRAEPAVSGGYKRGLKTARAEGAFG